MSRSPLTGDPFAWFEAGEFGSTRLDICF